MSQNYAPRFYVFLARGVTSPPGRRTRGTEPNVDLATLLFWYAEPPLPPLPLVHTLRSALPRG